jgi:hypothetical protein
MAFWLCRSQQDQLLTLLAILTRKLQRYVIGNNFAFLVSGKQTSSPLMSRANQMNAVEYDRERWYVSRDGNAEPASSSASVASVSRDARKKGATAVLAFAEMRGRQALCPY